MTVVLTRYYSEIDLAAYGMAISIGLILQGIQRNSYVIQNSILDFKVLRARGRKIIAEQIIAIFPLLLVLACLSAVAATYAPENLVSKTLAASTYCYIIFSQLEFERIILLKYQKNLIPFLTACVFVLLVLAMFFLNAHITFYELIAIMTIFAVLKASILIWIIGKPDFKGGWILLRRDFRKNSMSSIMGVIGYSAYTHASVLFLGMYSQAVQAAAFVAMRSIMHILQIIIRSMDVVDKNFFRSRVSDSEHGLLHVVNRQTLIYAAVSIILSGSVCVFSTPLINLFYHGKYAEFSNILYVWAGITTTFSILQPLESAIIMKKLFNKYNYVRMWMGFLTCGVLYFVAGPFGAIGVAIVTLVALVVSYIVGYKMLLDAVREDKNIKRKKRTYTSSLFRRIEGKMHRVVATRFSKKMIKIPQDFKGVTFSFDDFPETAATIGAEILEKNNARGTYYTCFGLLGQSSPSGNLATIDQVLSLANRGHEIGCHTHEHINCSYESSAVAVKSCNINVDGALEMGIVLKNFSYPEGGMRLSTKRAIQKIYTTARTVRVGINKGLCNAYALHAVAMYKNKVCLDVYSMIDEVEKNGGWLILYTHDLSENPSQYGITPKDFESMVQHCRTKNIPILTVQQVMDQIQGFAA